MFAIFQSKEKQDLKEKLIELEKYADNIKMYYYEEVSKQKLLSKYLKKQLDEKKSFELTTSELEFFNTEVSRLRILNEKLTEQNETLKAENSKLKKKENYHAKKVK